MFEWAVLGGRGRVLTLIKNLFGFETLVFVTLGISSMHNQLVTLQRERKTWNRIIGNLKGKKIVPNYLNSPYVKYKTQFKLLFTDNLPFKPSLKVKFA